MCLALTTPSAVEGRALRSFQRVSGIVTKGGLEGVACTDDEYERFKTIVCKVEKACGCAETVCELEWCATYVHNWKKEFGACLLKGCPADEEAAAAANEAATEAS